MNHEILDAPFDESNFDNRQLKKASALKNIQAIVIDYIFLIFLSLLVSIVPVIIFILFILTYQDSQSAQNYVLLYITLTFSTLGALSLSIFLAKDIVNGASFGKKMTGLIIMDITTNLPASEKKCILRNLSLFLWFIEGFLMLIHPHRRIGDFIVGTQVLQTKKMSFAESWREIKQHKYKLMKYICALTSIMAILISISIFS